MGASYRMTRAVGVVTIGLFASCAVSEDVPVSHDVIVIQEVHHDTSPALRDMQPIYPVASYPHENEPVRRIPRPPPHIDRNALREVQVLEPTLVGPLAPTALTTFDGIGNGVGGFTVNSAPPDTDGDVGPNHYVQIVNSDIAVFNKTTGAILFGPVPTNTLWSGFGGNCEADDDGDGTVVYDPIADRWVIAQFA